MLLAYRIALTSLVTVVAVLATAGAPEYPAAAWVIGLGAPVVMALRLVRPLTAYVSAAVLMLATGGPDLLMPAVLSASLAHRAARGRQVIAGLAVGWICAVLSTLWEEPLSLDGALLMSALFALTAVLPAGVARLVRRRRSLVAAMHDRNVQLHRQQHEIARRAQVRERARIARDMHDALGHKLTLLNLYAGMLPSTGEADRDEVADHLRTTSAAAMAELRQILGILAQDDTQPAVRPLSGLDDLVAQARASGARIELVREGEPRPLAALIEHAAYRVIQEGVTNALRHAAGATVVVTLRYEPDAVIAGVVNTAGRRIAGPTTGQGLLGLAERVRVAGGVLYSGPGPEGGFRLAATMPYEVTGAADAAGSDFTHLIDRSRRRSRRLLVVVTLAVSGFLVLCCAGGWVSTTLVTVDREQYDAIHIGRPESEVRALLPDPDLMESDVAGVEPPAGADCVDHPASLLEDLRAAPDSIVYRFCFRDGLLVGKQALRVEP